MRVYACTRGRATLRLVRVEMIEGLDVFKIPSIAPYRKGGGTGTLLGEL